MKEIVKKFIRYLKHGLTDNANVQTMIKTTKVLINIVEKAPNKQLMQVHERLINDIIILFFALLGVYGQRRSHGNDPQCLFRRKISDDS